MQRLSSIKDTQMIVGYNDKFPNHQLPPDKCELILNGFLDSSKIIERTGYSMYGNDTGENKPNLGFFAHKTSSANQLLKINDNAGGTAAVMYYKNAVGNWTLASGANSFTAGLTCELVTAAGNTYITNGTDTDHKWDGTTLTTVAAIPIGRYMRWYHNFLWVFNTSAFHSRAYFSSIGAPETFPIANFIDISPDDGDVITGSGIMRDTLYIGKQFHTYSFQGWSEDDFTVATINDELSSHGTVSNESYVNFVNNLAFLSYVGDIPHFKSIQVTQFSSTVDGGIISNDIEGTMQTLSKDQLSKCATIFDGRKVWWFVPNGASTFNDLAVVLDTVTGGWSKHTGIFAARAVSSSISGHSKIYFADSRNSKVYVFDGGNSDDGNAIDFQYISRQFEPDFKRFYKFKYLFIQFKAGQTGTFDVYTGVDDLPFDLIDTIDLTYAGSTFPATFTFPFGGDTVSLGERLELPYGVFHMCSIKFAKKDTNPRMTIFQYELMGFPRNIRDLPSG